jgi:hypothetical protein
VLYRANDLVQFIRDWDLALSVFAPHLANVLAKIGGCSSHIAVIQAWGIASFRQTTNFTPGYIAERACREELLDIADMMTSPTQ